MLKQFKCIHSLDFNATVELIAFIEFCFECINKYRPSSQKIRTGDFCVEKYELFRNFF